MVKIDFLIKQALIATGCLVSMVFLGQANAWAASFEAEGTQREKSEAIALAESAKVWYPADAITPPMTEQVPLELAQTPAQPLVETGVGAESSEPAPVEPPAPAAIEPPAATTLEASPLQPIEASPTASPSPAPLALQEDSVTAEDLMLPSPQDPPSLAPAESDTLDVIQAPEPTEIAQGVGTRYRFSYIGIGPNIGITGDTAIGDTSFAIVSRFAITPQFSARPAVFIEDDVSILLPVTYDFPITGPGNVAPYVGGGLTINTGGDSAVDLLLSAGFDVPLNDNFALTAGVNAAPFDEFDLGVHVAIAYTFGQVITPLEPVDLGAVETEVEETAAELGLEGRATNPSFVGLGANVGIGGDTALGDTSFAILSKITVAPSISVRPSLLIEDGVTLLVPVTYDFAGFSTEFISFYPFIGAGTAVSFGDDDGEFDLLLTAGVDIPITSNLALTSSFNAGVIDSFDIGVLLGLVYTFSSF